MTHLATLTALTADTIGEDAETAPQVWIMMKGEDHEGGTIKGVYLDAELAVGDFLALARQIDTTFGIDQADRADDGSFHVHGGCDWLSLSPYDVTTRRELPE
ncbi:hypothetical protein [Streptomyces nanshensis]|uniref:Uncharacterized protein n=1 Tax=Streptomyces nanshensis TaxID=518642 RepID=A0A1E7LCV7_9ACTN|nr:hypothetical protein [Streptomyces nanshensis]OEV13803.1 hypothetical protein AN218_01850 [Streptomyces nanshensis]